MVRLEISQAGAPGFQAFIRLGPSYKRFTRATPNGDALTNFNRWVMLAKHREVAAHLAIG
ncbi:hypothetical protein [Synechococcus lacustris]|uniref:hypothetical protein n=1 Tax=Synechococcus lacustris TaxID=2116544 RepID=UPI00333E69E4